MKYSVAMLTVCLVICGGCSNGDDVARNPVVKDAPKTKEENVTFIERTFVEAPEDIRQEASTAARAMQENDYQQAAMSIMNLQGSKGTLEQNRAAYQSMRQFQSDLANAVASGDANAIAAAEYMKRRIRQ